MINFIDRDTTIEYSAVGAMLIDAKCINAALAIVAADDFSDKLCRAAVQAITLLRDSNSAIDAVLIYDKAKELYPDFPFEFVRECMTLCPTAANVEEYCKLIKAGANAARLADIADEISTSAFNRVPPEQIISKLRQDVDTIELKNTGVLSSAATASEWLKYDELVKADPDAAYCKTGFKDLDRVLGGGMFKSGLYIIGARPGMGKTTLGIGIAENIASRGKPVLFVSLEMGSVQIMAKRIARKSGINYTALMTGSVQGVELNRASETIKQLSNAPFYLSDNSLCRVSDIESMAHNIKDLACIVIDYFGLLTAEQTDAVRTRYEETTELSKALKSLSKRLSLPVVCLCQLNRENGSRADKRPKLSDLRDTGALEQDADCVILLHREEYYESRGENAEPPEFEYIELNVAKNRHGETQTVKMLWSGATGNIAETTNRADEPTTYKPTSSYDELPF